MSFVFSFLGELLFGWLWWLIPDQVERRSDLKRYLEGEVRCSIRAIDRRVLKIGTELSVGVAQFEPGMLRFSASVGIVGDRVVPVQSIRPGPTPNALAPATPGVDFIVSTTGGELMVRFPTAIADQVAAVLAGLTPEPEVPGA